jgi:hypothetical protein
VQWELESGSRTSEGKLQADFEATLTVVVVSIDNARDDRLNQSSSSLAKTAVNS